MAEHAVLALVPWVRPRLGKRLRKKVKQRDGSQNRLLRYEKKTSHMCLPWSLNPLYPFLRTGG